MERTNLKALGLSALTLGGVALTHRPPARPVPPSTTQRATVARGGTPVRQNPSLGSPILGTLSQGDVVVVDPTETAFPGFIPLVRESIDEAGVRFERVLGWAETGSVAPVALAATGLVAGRHTLAETRDLLAVADYRFREVLKAMAELPTRPLPLATRADLEADFARLRGQWEITRREVARNLALKGAAFPIFFRADMIPTEDEWVRVLAFVQGQELVKGSLQDITRRLEQALGRQIRFENQPAQNSRDVDLAVFQALDEEIRAGEVQAARAASAAKEAATSPTGLAIGTTLALLGGGLLTIAFLPEIRMVLGAGRAVYGAARRS